MIILIVYLTLKDFVPLFSFIHYVNISLFHWVYFTSFLIIILDRICFYLFRSSHYEIFYIIAVLNQFLLKLQAIGMQLY